MSHRQGTEYVNVFVLEEDGAITLVDTCPQERVGALRGSSCRGRVGP